MIYKEDFKEYAKKEFNQNIEFVKSDNPDTIESLFGPMEAPTSEAIRPVAFDDIGLEEAILDLDYIKELEEENEDLRQRLTNVANCLSNILQIVKDPTPIEGSDYRRCCLIQSNIRKYAISLKESKTENDDLVELRIIFGRPLNG